MINILQGVTNERQRLVENVRRWGDLNTDAILDKGCQIFSVPDIDGLIGYRIESHFAIVFGDPVCASEDKIALATAFKEYCQTKKLGVIYAMASDSFANSATKDLCPILIEFGDKFIFNPQNNVVDNTGSKAILVRKKVKKALKYGVRVQEYTSHDPELESALEQVGTAWLNTRHGPQVHIAHLNFFADRIGKRWFYAKYQDKIVGVLLLNQLQVHDGWLLNNVMFTPQAPKGTSELLVNEAFDTLKKESCNYVACGPMPSQKLGKITGLGSFTTWAARLMFLLARKLFRLDGHRNFWEKFIPNTEPSYLLFDQKNLSIGAVRALMRALNAPV